MLLAMGNDGVMQDGFRTVASADTWRVRSLGMLRLMRLNVC